MGYAFILLVFTMIAHNRGHHEVWVQSVKHTNFFAPAVDAPSDEPGGGVPPQVLALQPQYTGVVTPPPMITTPPPMFATPPPQGMPFGVIVQPQPMHPMSQLYAGSPII